MRSAASRRARALRLDLRKNDLRTRPWAAMLIRTNGGGGGLVTAYMTRCETLNSCLAPSHLAFGLQRSGLCSRALSYLCVHALVRWCIPHTFGQGSSKKISRDIGTNCAKISLQPRTAITAMRARFEVQGTGHWEECAQGLLFCQPWASRGCSEVWRGEQRP